MNRSSALRSAACAVALATCAVLLPATGSSYAVAPPPAVSRGADSDGDGIPDAGDGCPTVASGNPTGCPSASRTARLTWLEGKRRLQVRVTSPVDACASRARISLWRVYPRQDEKVLGTNLSRGGKARFRAVRGATYYVKVSPSYSSGIAECLRDDSRRVTVPRR